MKNILISATFLFALSASAQTETTTQKDTIQSIEEVVISGTLPNKSALQPNLSTLEAKGLSISNTGRDIPVLLQYQPNTITTSDAGNGIGYTGIRVRGSDATRTNITVNGVPINDAESQGTFWVNMPDLSSSAQAIYVQRGLSNSTTGAGSFGASVNIQTADQLKKYTQVNFSVGSFNTYKFTGQFHSGFIPLKKSGNFLSFSGRISSIGSDGFIDRAYSNLFGYMGSMAYFSKGFNFKLLGFGGKEKTYQAWYGVPIEKYNMGNPSLNQAGRDTQLFNHYLRNAGPGYTYQNSSDSLNLFNSKPNRYNYYDYKNQTDNYQQHHLHAYFYKKLGVSTHLNATAYFTHGEGFYEEFKYLDKLANYNLPNLNIYTPGLTISSTNADLVRQKWLSNNLVGTNINAITHIGSLELNIGIAGNRYHGVHFGQVMQVMTHTTFATSYDNFASPYRYYTAYGDKQDYSGFIKLNQIKNLSFGKLAWYADLQIRQIHYTGSGFENQDVNFDSKFSFINPKAGFSLENKINNSWKGILAASVARANHEPGRQDFTDNKTNSIPKPEQLTDYELGYTFIKSSTDLFQANAYFMDYVNQLVLSGAVNDVGTPLRINIPNSYRKGLEFVVMKRIWQQENPSKNLYQSVDFKANYSISENIINHSPASWFDYASNQSVDTVYHHVNIAYSPKQVAMAGFIYNFVWKGNGLKPEQRISLNYNFKFVDAQNLDNTGDASRSIPAYNFSEFGLYYSKKMLNQSEFRIGFQVLNAFNQYYTNNGYTFGYMYGSRAIIQEVYVYPQAGRNFMFNVNVTL